MKTSLDIAMVEHDRMRMGPAGYALALSALTAALSRPTHADAPPSPPPSDCSDFACQK